MNGNVWRLSQPDLVSPTILSSAIFRGKLMDSKRTSRRQLLKGSAALAGGLALGVPVHAQEHDHGAVVPGNQNNSPMILGTKELVEYGQRSKYVTSVRISHPIGGRPSPDDFGKVMHVAS